MAASANIEGVLGELRASSAERQAQVARLADRVDEVVERLASMEMVANRAAERAEGVAKALHELRADLLRADALNPEKLRAYIARDMRAMLEEEHAKIVAKMEADQERRDATLRRGGGILLSAILSIGTAAYYLAGWVVDNLPGISAIAKMWKGGGQ